VDNKMMMMAIVVERKHRKSAVNRQWATLSFRNTKVLHQTTGLTPN